MRKKRSFREVWEESKIVWISIITLAILFVPINLIHETGHILVCVSFGFDYTFKVGNFAFIVQCSNSPSSLELYWSLGGIFGMVSSLILLSSNRIRENHGIFIGISVITFDQMQKTIFETFAHSAYLSNLNLTIFTSIISLIFWSMLLWFFRKRSNKIT